MMMNADSLYAMCALRRQAMLSEADNDRLAALLPRSQTRSVMNEFSLVVERLRSFSSGFINVEEGHLRAYRNQMLYQPRLLHKIQTAIAKQRQVAGQTGRDPR